jgi:hypothetical protein
VIFATRGKNHRKYRGFGFPRRRKHRYLRCFLLREGQKNAKTPPMWRFLSSQKCDNKMCCTNNNSNNNNNKKHKQHKNATKKCVTIRGMTSTSSCALHLCSRAEHANVRTTIHNLYGVAGLRSSTIIVSNTLVGVEHCLNTCLCIFIETCLPTSSWLQNRLRNTLQNPVFGIFGHAHAINLCNGVLAKPVSTIFVFCSIKVRIIPECVARVPVSLRGPGGWGCVRSTLRNCSRPFVTVRNRSREVAMAVPMVSSATGGWRFHMSRSLVSCGRRGSSWHSDVLRTCRKSFCMTGTIHLRRFQKMSFRGV